MFGPQMSFLPMLPVAVQNYLVDNIRRELFEIAISAKPLSAQARYNILDDENNDLGHRYKILVAAAREMGSHISLSGIYEERPATLGRQWFFELKE